MTHTSRRRRAAAVGAFTATLMLILAGPASATTNVVSTCSGGDMTLVVADGPDANKIRVTQLLNADSPFVVNSVEYGVSWRNERTGATGRTNRATDFPNNEYWQRSWTITTGSGNVVVTWDDAVVTEFNRNNGAVCAGEYDLRAQAIAR